jgi:hypothetical protein
LVLDVDGTVVAILVIDIDSLRLRGLGFGGFIIVESECFTCPVCDSRVARAEEEEEDGFVGDAGTHIRHPANGASTASKAHSTPTTL